MGRSAGPAAARPAIPARMPAGSSVGAPASGYATAATRTGPCARGLTGIQATIATGMVTGGRRETRPIRARRRRVCGAAGAQAAIRAARRSSAVRAEGVPCGGCCRARCRKVCRLWSPLRRGAGVCASRVSAPAPHGSGDRGSANGPACRQLAGRSTAARSMGRPHAIAPCAGRSARAASVGWFNARAPTRSCGLGPRSPAGTRGAGSRRRCREQAGAHRSDGRRHRPCTYGRRGRYCADAPGYRPHGGAMSLSRAARLTDKGLVEWRSFRDPEGAAMRASEWWELPSTQGVVVFDPMGREDARYERPGLDEAAAPESWPRRGAAAKAIAARAEARAANPTAPEEVVEEAPAPTLFDAPAPAPVEPVPASGVAACPVCRGPGPVVGSRGRDDGPTGRLARGECPDCGQPSGQREADLMRRYINTRQGGPQVVRDGPVSHLKR